MANTHFAALFDYENYREIIRPIVSQVDENYYEELRKLTCQAIEDYQENWPLSDYGMIKYIDGVKSKVLTQEWPLYNHGGEALITVNEVQSNSSPRQDELGFWFLIVLGRFLQSCITPSSNWSILDAVLEQLGWGKKPRKLLFKGLPTSGLLKPSINQYSPWPLTENDPYWFWLHPWASRSGWLTTEIIHELYSNILEVKNEVLRIDISFFPNIDLNNPIVVEDYENRIRNGYEQTVQMLLTSIENDKGLFMSITNYS